MGPKNETLQGVVTSPDRVLSETWVSEQAQDIQAVMGTARWQDVYEHNRGRKVSWWGWIKLWTRWRLGYYGLNNILLDMLTDEIRHEIDQEILGTLRDLKSA